MTGAPMVEYCLSAKHHFEELKFFVIYKYENKGYNWQDIKKFCFAKKSFGFVDFTRSPGRDESRNGPLIPFIKSSINQGRTPLN